jgi:uncharacterized protein Yka (UPF0111/DUF47 family)
MINRIEILEKEVDILSRKVNILADMFKDYVENESKTSLESGKWYPETIDTI